MDDIFFFMRTTTIRLDDRLLKEAKKAAAERGTTLTALVGEGLRIVLAPSKRPSRRRRVRLPTSGAGGLRAGVDLDSSALLWELTEKDAPSRR
jgi:hypothetical protein